MFKWVGALFDRICAVIGAIICAQTPLFMQQYAQQLIGRTAELELQVESMRQSAKLSGKSLEQLINKFITNSDIDFVRQGELMQNVVERWHHLTQSLASLQQSSVFERPFIFISNLNVDIFKSTLKNYSIGLPLTIEGGVYGLIGIAIGYCLFAGVRQLWQRTLKFTFSRPRQANA